MRFSTGGISPGGVCQTQIRVRLARRSRYSGALGSRILYQLSPMITLTTMAEIISALRAQ